MQDLKTDFYKRYSHDGGTADTVFCPYSAALFGGIGEPGILPVLCVRLSFGAKAAFRQRDDDRIVMSLTDSDVRAEINKANIERLHSPVWAREIVNSLARLPAKLGGIELLIHSDVAAPELAPRKLCAVQAAAKSFGMGFSPAVILRAAQENAQYLPSLLAESQRAAIVNTATLGYIGVDFFLPSHKMVIARLPIRRRTMKFTNTFKEHELERINIASEILKNGNAYSLAPVMSDASLDMLQMHKKSTAEQLFLLCREFTDAVRIMPDYRGAITFIPNNKVDEFVRTVNDRFEKKAGIRPAFYISD